MNDIFNPTPEKISDYTRGKVDAIYMKVLNNAQSEIIRTDLEETNNQQPGELRDDNLPPLTFDPLRTYLRETNHQELVKLGDNNLPSLTKEGKLVSRLMQEVSREILEKASNFSEYRQMLSVFLAFIECNSSSKILELTPEQQQEYKQVLEQIIGEAIDLFEDAYTVETVEINGTQQTRLKAIEGQQADEVRASGRKNASDPGSKYAAEVVRVMSSDLPSTNNEELQLAELKNQTTAQDIYRMVCKVLGYQGRRFPQLGTQYLTAFINGEGVNGFGKNLVDNLESDDAQKLLDIVLRSETPSTAREDALSDKTLFAVLGAVHMSWAGAQGLAGKERLERSSYKPFPIIKFSQFQNAIDFFTLESGQKPTEEMIDIALMAATLELMKDLIYLKVAPAATTLEVA